MNPKRLKQVEEIYHAALEILPEKRESFFAKHCGDDIRLRCEVESLLSFNNSSDNLLNTPPESLAAEIFSENEQENFVGRKIGHYKIQKLLGRGGMGEVYLAQDTKLKRQVALKFLPPEFAQNNERMRRFIREARSASALNHPNIITIYEINEFEGKHFIATEYIDGKTLNEYKQSNSLGINSALEIAVQIASALDEAHSAGIIHRDIKPDNVMIRSNGLVKILDFGIAKLSEPSESAGGFNLNNSDNKVKLSATAKGFDIKTNHGMIIGTANYMSPEQARGGEIDTRTDIFSFGVVLYEMLKGKPLSEGNTALETIDAILHKEPEPFDDFEIPIEIKKIIGKCLKKDKDERYQTIKDLLIDLNDVKRNAGFQINLERTIQPNEEEPETKILQAIISDKLNQTTNQTV